MYQYIVDASFSFDYQLSYINMPYLHKMCIK